MFLTSRMPLTALVLGGVLLATGASLSAFGLVREDRPPPNRPQTANGTFVAFKDGTLTIQGKSGLLTFKDVGANYTAFQNNEDGPGAKRVETVTALSSVRTGAVFQVDEQARELSFGLDYRVIGTLESYQDGKLTLAAVEAPAGFVKRPVGTVVLAVASEVPLLESVQGAYYTHAGSAGELLKTLKKGTKITARSEYDPDVIEVLQVGEPRGKIERYYGQTRGTVRGGFVSFNNGIFRIRGKGIKPLAANEYERVIGMRITPKVSVVESIDGGPYKPVGQDALKSLREGTTVTVRKVEEVVLEIQIGMAK